VPQPSSTTRIPAFEFKQRDQFLPAMQQARAKGVVVRRLGCVKALQALDMAATARHAAQHAQQDLALAERAIQRGHLGIVPTRKPE
jgi:hypothetical protein